MKFKIGAALLLAAFVAIFLTFCSGSKNAPAAVAVAFIERSYKGDVDGAMSLVHVPDSSQPLETQMALNKIKAMINKAEEKADRKGGVEAITVQSSTIDANDPNRARVILKVRFKQGSESTDEVSLIQVKGQWKIFIGLD